MIRSDTIYSKDNAGRLRYWFYEVVGDSFSVITGLDGSAKQVRSKPKVCKPKSQADGHTQAIFEAEAAKTKKLRIDYHETAEDAMRYGPKVFLPMLSKVFEDAPVIEKGWSQPKYDGIRSVIHRHRMTGIPGAFSREGKEQLTVPFLVEELLPLLNGEFTFDGELYNHAMKDDFNKIVSLVRKTNVTAADIEAVKNAITYYCYDVYIPGMKFSDRLFALQQLADTHAFRHLEVAETTWFDSLEERDELFAEYLADGYEGQIIRAPDEPYYTDSRPNACVKRKTLITEEFNVRRLEEGRGNWAGAVARVIVDLPNGTECETGIDGDYATRAKMLQEKDDYVDGTATVRFLNWTPDGKLRGGVTKDLVKGERED